MSKAFDVLSSALDEAIAHSRAEGEAKSLREKTISLAIEPIEKFSAEDIKKIRAQTGLTQSLFAKWFGVSTRTVEAWEAGRSTPSGPSNRLLGLLQSHRLSIAH